LSQGSEKDIKAVQRAVAKLLPTSNHTDEDEEDEDDENEDDDATALLTPAALPAMVPTLLAATAGFPKIHRVWDFLMGGIFPLDGDRALPSARYVYPAPPSSLLLLLILTQRGGCASGDEQHPSDDAHL
jgi:hypothetical protein